MGSWGNCDFREMKEFQEKLNKLVNSNERFILKLSKEITAILLERVIKLTPIGDYSKVVSFTTKDGRHVSFQPHNGKTGGTLKHGWTSKPVFKRGDIYVMTVFNPVNYANYVEFGHRKPYGKGWVPGRFMLTNSEKALKTELPVILERKVAEQLRRCMS